MTGLPCEVGTGRRGGRHDISRVQRILRAGLRVLVRVGMLTLLGGVVAVFGLAKGDDPDLQSHNEAVSVEFDPATAARYKSLADAPFDRPILLNYHDIAPDARAPYRVTPRDFAAQMHMLKLAGFHTMSAAELVRYLRTGEGTDHSLVITFDDGTSGLWTHADSILEQCGFRAIVFVITGRVGTHRPYYLTWKELAKMQETGRWDIESHSHDGHDWVAIDAEGTTGPFMINRAWLSEAGRLESLAEYRRRVERDLRRSIAEIESHGFGRPQLFAYPFSASVKPSNDVQAAAYAKGLVNELFEGGLTNISPPTTYLSERQRLQRQLERIEVFTDTTSDELFERVRDSLPIAVEDVPAPAEASGWLDRSGETTALRMEDGTFRLGVQPGSWAEVTFAPQQTEDWTNYLVQVQLDPAAPAGTDSSSGLEIGVGGEGDYRIDVSAGWFRVDAQSLGERSTIAEGPIAAPGPYTVLAVVRPHEVSFEINGVVVHEIASQGEIRGGIGLRVRLGPVAAAEPAFRNLTVASLG